MPDSSGSLRDFGALLQTLPQRKIIQSWHERLPFLLCVVLPAFLTFVYFFAFASKQYVSETLFLVRSAEGSSPKLGGLGELLSVGGGFGTAESEARAVNNYLISHDAIEAMRAQGVDLVAIYRRPGADWIARLGSSRPQAETLRRYFRSKVHVAFDPPSGVTTLRVRAFTPKDAQVIAATLVALGEARVNAFNQRANEAALAGARAGITDAEKELSQIQRRLTSFRDQKSDIDPISTASARQNLVAGLEEELAAARTEQTAALRALPAGSPQLAALAGRVDALQKQIANERQRLTGSAGAVSPRLADYEELKLQQQFAANRYEAARLALELAHKQALKQQLFMAAVVNPNLPQRSTAPDRLGSVLTVTIGLFLIYAIGWLIIAGVREHEG